MGFEEDISALKDLPSEVAAKIEESTAVMESIRDISFEGESPDGAVVARVRGLKDIVAIKIDRASFRKIDNISLGESVVAAVVNAESAARQRVIDDLSRVHFWGNSIGEIFSSMYPPGEMTQGGAE